MRCLKYCLSAALLLLLPLMVGLAPAKAAYPSEPVHIVVPWPAGGGTDSIARAFAAALEKSLGTSVLVDNVVGAGGITGTFQVAKAKPDGYTLLLQGSSDVTTAMVFQSTPFTLEDFDYLCAFYSTPTWVLAHKDRGYATLKDFLNAAEKNPGTLTLASATPAGAQLLFAAGIHGYTGGKFRIVPYQGGGPFRKGMLSNEVDAGIVHSPIMLPEVKDGLIRILATGQPLDKINYEPARKTTTMKEMGIPLEVGITRGIMLPKGTAPEVRAKLLEACKQAAAGQMFTDFGLQFGFSPVWMEGADFKKLMTEEMATFATVKQKFVDQQQK
ncbi:MAG: tripartite tricarboxylate transporter substrate binding protein [Deltaproteobacteria bacterium]|jgi:tripartite-type tricarboxylate transporter receptor subunit TctC|nr:tripartite tricarboxylate transporter substrate binding protein [Deltaproteobacteria bacterium]